MYMRLRHIHRFHISLSHSPCLLPLAKLIFFFGIAWSIGCLVGTVSYHFSKKQDLTVSAQAADHWGLSFPKEGARPAGNASIEELRTYNAWFAADTEEPVIYLTFDCGYENGNTPRILEALKKHHIPAVFFCTGNFVRDQPDLIRQMIVEGHLIGNHTMTHPDMSKIGTKEEFLKELKGVEDAYQAATGKTMPHFYRPPQGIYNTQNLTMAKDLGYQTFFWSLAYVDWIQDQQPTKEAAFEKLLKRIHPGAIVLLHNTSSTNASILDELLTRWEDMGYHFASLETLTAS